MSDVLVLEHVNKSFGPRPIISDLSLRVREGEVFGFLGPNGAGKTTTIKMILGLLSADSGKISVMGHDIVSDFEEAMRHISGIVENPDMYGYLSGYDNLLLQARACGVSPQRVNEVAELVGMQMRIRDKFRSYSLGMKQRLGVAQALLHNPKIMILDEPTNGLDPAGIKEVRDLLVHLAHTQGISVFVSSHILQEMQQMCDTVCIINGGKILRSGTVEELTHGTAGVVRYTLLPMDRALALLRENASDRIVAVGEHTVDIRVGGEEIDLLNRRLLENGVAIRGLSTVEQSLEQSFMEITGGGHVVG